VAGPLPKQSSIGVWYAVLIGAVLLIATGLYALSLHRQIEEWQDAARQLSIGQELLRKDRDEILDKARERESMLATLEAGREKDQIRLDGLEEQRRRLQANVLRLTQNLAQSEPRENSSDANAGQAQAVDKLERERDRLDRILDERDAEVARLQTTISELTETLDKNEGELEALRLEKADFDDARAALELDAVRAKEQLSERRRDERFRQIVRGHRRA
jgi:chromosome segregation ATPase